MPIRYRDQDDVDDLGTAGFLLVVAEPGGEALRGALFQVNLRGEPVEFTYSRVTAPDPFLWRADDLRRSALKKLAVSLFRAAQLAPRVLLCRAEQVPPDLFAEQLQLFLPVGRVNVEAGDDEPLVAWVGPVPDEGSPERQLTERLAQRGLLLEPFDRAAAGIGAVYGPT